MTVYVSHEYARERESLEKDLEDALVARVKLNKKRKKEDPKKTVKLVIDKLYNLQKK